MDLAESMTVSRWLLRCIANVETHMLINEMAE